MLAFEIEVSRGLERAIDVLDALGARELELDGERCVFAIFDCAVDVSAALVAAGVAADVRPALRVDHDSRFRPRRPLVFGGLVVSSEPRGDALVIDASNAFGSGVHETTALCLERIVARSPIEAFLDVGTGSGILALAAAKLGARRVVAVELDAGARAAARANAQRNGLELELHAGLETVAGQLTVVAANILAPALIALAPALVRTLAPRSLLLLSGIRSDATTDVTRTYRNLGVHTVAEEHRGGWALLELEPSW